MYRGWQTRAMVDLLRVYFASSIVCAFADTPLVGAESNTDTYSYVFEILVTLTIVLLASTLWLLTLVAGSAKKSSRLVADAGVQCDAHNCEPTGHLQPHGAIHFAPNSARWHADRSCRHLRNSGAKVTDLTPCKTCCRSSLWEDVQQLNVQATIVVEQCWTPLRKVEPCRLPALDEKRCAKCLDAGIVKDWSLWNNVAFSFGFIHLGFSWIFILMCLGFHKLFGAVMFCHVPPILPRTCACARGAKRLWPKFPVACVLSLRFFKQTLR